MFWLNNHTARCTILSSNDAIGLYHTNLEKDRADAENVFVRGYSRFA